MGAVITGDIIQSTMLTDNDRKLLFEEIGSALKTWEKDFKMKSEIFRGDSFQCYIANNAEALKIALIQKTYIRSLNPSTPFTLAGKHSKPIQKRIFQTKLLFDARISIGIGSVNIQSNKLSVSSGTAFVLSGRSLDKMKGKKQTLSIATDDRFNGELQTECILLDALISKTSALQCEVLNLKLLGYTEIEIAKELDIDQSAVNQRSQSGSWNAIEAMLKRFERMYAYEK